MLKEYCPLPLVTATGNTRVIFFLPSSMKRTARGQVSLQHVLARKHLGGIGRVEGVDATRYVPVIKVWDAGLKHTQTLTV